MIEVTLKLDDWSDEKEGYTTCQTTYRLDNKNPLPYLTSDNCIDLINSCVELGFNVLDEDIDEHIKELQDAESNNIKTINDKIKLESEKFHIRNVNYMNYCNDINYLVANVYGERVDRLEHKKNKVKYPIVLLCEDKDTSFKCCSRVIYPDNLQLYDILLSVHKLYEDSIKYLISCNYSNDTIKEIINNAIDKTKKQLNNDIDNGKYELYRK